MPAAPTCPHCRTPLIEAPPSGLCPVCGTPWDTRPGAPADDTRSLSPAAIATPAYPGAATLPLAPQAAAGRRPPSIPNYRDLTYLAGGGMGAVFRGVQCGTNRTVAIKVIHGAAAFDPAVRVRFANEMQALGRVKHPNVVDVYDTGTTDDTPFYSMEYVAGGTLAQRLVARGGALPPKEAAQIMKAVAEGVHAAHCEKILHRDLKPGNILIEEDGTPKVADFGLAKFTDSGFQLTVTGSLLGTPPYMAPEQFRGPVNGITVRSDVYGLGATLYECLTGRPPFRGATRDETMQLVLNTEPTPPTRLRPDVPKELEAVCLKCLAKNPAQRFATAQELADELGRLLTGEPTLTRPLTRLQKAGRWFRRHSARVAVGVLFVVLLGVLAAIWNRNPPAAGPTPDQVLAEIEATLAQGKPVELIPEKGLPKWHQWFDDPLEFAKTEDGACGIDAMYVSLLTVLRDPMVDSYRVSVELRHRRNTGEGSVGLAVGLDEIPHPNQGVTHLGVTQWWLFEYSDFWRPVEVKEPKLQADHGLDVGHLLWIRLPENKKAPHRIDYDVATRFTPTNQTPNDWRRLQLDVSPNGVTIYWPKDPQNPEPVPVRHLTRQQLESGVDRQNKKNRPELAGVALPARPWNPRRPIAIMAAYSSLDVRKLTVTPQ